MYMQLQNFLKGYPTTISLALASYVPKQPSPKNKVLSNTGRTAGGTLFRRQERRAHMALPGPVQGLASGSKLATPRDQCPPSPTTSNLLLVGRVLIDNLWQEE
ncbi:hypothetical protein FPOAC2_00740 [Fusarium poae]|jgi:hypothetical protein